jgi:predicted nucleotidyltransferase
MNTIALTPQELEIVTAIMHDYPNTVLFGSRVKGNNQPFSDLDICIKDPIDGYHLELLREQFEKSNLVFFVDLVPYARCNETFKKIIDTEGIQLISLT